MLLSRRCLRTFSRLSSSSDVIKPLVVLHEDPLEDQFVLDIPNKDSVSIKGSDSMRDVCLKTGLSVLNPFDKPIAETVLMRDVICDYDGGLPSVAFKLVSTDNKTVEVLAISSWDVFSLVLNTRVSEKETDDVLENDILKVEFKDLLNKKEEAERIADRSVKRIGLSVGMYLVAQNVALAYGVWVEYSWDVMEPICYFLNLGVASWGAIYFALAKRENSYKNLYQVIRDRRRIRMYSKYDVDLQRYTFLKRRFHKLL